MHARSGRLASTIPAFMVVAGILLGVTLASISGSEVGTGGADVLTAEQRLALLEDLRERLPPRYRDWPVHVVAGDFSPAVSPATTGTNSVEGQRDDTAAEKHESCAEVLAEVERLMAQLHERLSPTTGVGDWIFVAIGEGVSTQLRIPPPLTLERLRDAGWC
ncbi:MAG: hypothetical protein O6913_08385 [Chloroflexi bacterium]|nr:hypothetical protein [Chloroflexota bacterium]